MSRAFVSESDGEGEQDLPPLVSPLPPGARNYMTAAGLARLRADIDLLAHDERPPLADAVARMQAPASTASAAELRAAQHDLALLDRRLTYLNELLRTAEVVPAAAGTPDRAAFGTTVTVRDKMTGEMCRYRIVGVYEADPERNAVSWISPIAKALRGKQVGQTVTVPLPDEEKILKITEVVQE